jgi:hypothetical protein
MKKKSYYQNFKNKLKKQGVEEWMIKKIKQLEGQEVKTIDLYEDGNGRRYVFGITQVI